jgi:hypothetical protein
MAPTVSFIGRGSFFSFTGAEFVAMLLVVSIGWENNKWHLNFIMVLRLPSHRDQMRYIGINKETKLY